MTSELILGGLAGLLAFWYLVSAMDGLSYAFPMRPAVVMPSRSRGFSTALFVIVIIALTASFVTGPPNAPLYLPFLAVIVHALWEIYQAGIFGRGLIIVNGHAETLRPLIAEAARDVLGPLKDDDHGLRSDSDDGIAIRIDVYEKARVIALSPGYKVSTRQITLLEQRLNRAFRKVKATGFSPEGFWIATILPIGLALLYAFIAYALLSPEMNRIAMRGTIMS